MKILSVVGYHNSGKTTVVELIIAELTKGGYRVGSIKDIHIEGFSIDVEGKDTWRHKHAGSSIVGVSAINEASILFPHPLGVDDLIPVFHHFETEVLVLEGFSKAYQDSPRIVCARQGDDSLIKDHLTSKTVAISGLISEERDRFNEIPVLNVTRDAQALMEIVKTQLF